MKTVRIGRGAEAAVSLYLESKGFKILDRNWRTKVCEIDLVTSKDDIVFFIEVKYRMRDEQGDGFDYITPKKLTQMEFAARLWCSVNKWEGDYRLAAASVKGVRFDHIEIIEL